MACFSVFQFSSQTRIKLNSSRKILIESIRIGGKLVEILSEHMLLEGHPGLKFFTQATSNEFPADSGLISLLEYLETADK